MHESLLVDLAIVTCVAACTNILVKRLGQPNILGYLLAGLIVGPYIPIPLFADPSRIEELAEVGVVLVMFAIGLEFQVRGLLKMLPTSGLAGAIQIAALMSIGTSVGQSMGWSIAASLCLGSTVAISSTMVVGSVLRSVEVEADTKTHVFGVLIIQDVVAILLIAVVTALASGEQVTPQSLLWLSGSLLGFVVLLLAIALLVLPRLVRAAFANRDSEAVVVLVVASAFGLAATATSFGYSEALGAFVAGVAIAESGRERDVEHLIEPLRGLFSAVFFVSIGMAVDPVVAWSVFPLALGVTAVVIVGQFLAVLIATLVVGQSLRRGVYAGLLLGQIGELSFIIAKIGIAGSVLPKETLSVLVTVATITAFTTSFFLRRAPYLVDRLDQALPDRANHWLVAYQSLVRQAQRPSHGEGVVRKAAAALLLDWFAIVLVFVGYQVLRTSTSVGVGFPLSVAAIVLASPFVLGLIRSVVRLAAGIRNLAQSSGALSGHTRAVESAALLALSIAAGVPTLALLRPIIAGTWAEALSVMTLLSLIVVVGWRLGLMRSGAAVTQIALGIERRAKVTRDGDYHGAPFSDQAFFDGVDYQPVTIQEEAEVQGTTLAELNLRSRTGAMVVAIWRGDHLIKFPTGHESILARDVLAVSGSTEALDRARLLLK